MPKLYAGLVDVLEQDWPHALNAWERVQGMVSDRALDRLYRSWSKVHAANECYPDPGASALPSMWMATHGDSPLVPVIRLAQDLSLTRVLPAAWYELQKWWPEPGVHTSAFWLRVQAKDLTHEDLQRFVHGKAKVDMAVRGAYASLRDTALEDCYRISAESEEDLLPLQETALCSKHLVRWFDEQVTTSILGPRNATWPPYDVFAELKTMKTCLAEGVCASKFLESVEGHFLCSLLH